MVWIKRSDVPEYLQRSSFYELLDPDDNTAFEIAADHFKKDENVRSTDDLRHMLSTVRFWGVYDVAVLVIPFIMREQVENSMMLELCHSFPEYRDTLQSLVRIKACEPNCVIAAAIKCGFGVSVVSYLYQYEGCLLSSDAYVEAVKMNDVQSVMYLRKQDCPWDVQTTISAICTNNKEMLEFVVVNGCALPDDAMHIAARAGHVDMMKYLHAMGIPYPITVYQGIVCLPAVRFLRSVGCNWHPSSCVHFAARGQLDCLVYAHENGCPWDAKVCAAAACYGHLRCLQYAHDFGCPWDEKTMNCSARYGQFECLQYAYLHGCPMEATTVNSALAFSQWRCLLFLLWRSVYPADVPFVMSYLVLFLCGMLVAALRGNMQTMYAISFCTCTMGFLLHVLFLIFGPHYLQLKTQLQFHFMILLVQAVVGLVSNVSFLFTNIFALV